MKAGNLPPDTVLQNRYRILSLLKQGGMGRIYLAEDQRFRSQVAVKEAYFTQDKFRQAFAHEAGLLHRLRHQVLPHVTDHFTEGDAQYLVMQLFPGKDLDELLTEKLRETGEAFATEQVLLWADQLLDALEYLHGHQPPIVHRDIKPQNLKLTARGEIILLDFGLAKGAATEMSQAGESMPGYTRHYAPLEQMRGAGTDPRADLYALAATIHRLITGRLPPDALTRATATLEQRPDPLRLANELNEQVPEAVADALMRALAQLPDERPATAAEMRQALREASQGRPPGDYDTTISIDGARAEIAPHNGEPEIGAVSSSAQTLTNAGQIIAPSPAPGVDESGAISDFARFRPGASKSGRIALGLLLLTIAVLAYLRLNHSQGSGGVRPWETVAPPDSSPPPTPWDEVMRYYLQVESDIGKAERVAGEAPIVKGRWLKFHFTPRRRGYLYILAPGERATRATFLTSQPNLAWGVESNLLAAGADHIFPPRHDKWIEVARGANFRTYTIIFTPEPLAHPSFLAEAADRDLTVVEENELAELRKQFGRQARTETYGDYSIVAIPAERGTDAPFLFEINLRHGADKEGGKR